MNLTKKFIQEFMIDFMELGLSRYYEPPTTDTTNSIFRKQKPLIEEELLNNPFYSIFFNPIIKKDSDLPFYNNTNEFKEERRTMCMRELRMGLNLVDEAGKIMEKFSVPLRDFPSLVNCYVPLFKKNLFLMCPVNTKDNYYAYVNIQNTTIVSFDYTSYYTVNEFISFYNNIPVYEDLLPQIKLTNPALLKYCCLDFRALDKKFYETICDHVGLYGQGDCNDIMTDYCEANPTDHVLCGCFNAVNEEGMKHIPNDQNPDVLIWKALREENKKRDDDNKILPTCILNQCISADAWKPFSMTNDYVKECPQICVSMLNAIRGKYSTINVDNVRLNVDCDFKDKNGTDPICLKLDYTKDKEGVSRNNIKLNSTCKPNKKLLGKKKEVLTSSQVKTSSHIVFIVGIILIIIVLFIVFYKILTLL